MFLVCHAFLFVHCSLLVCWERANLLALLNVMFYCVFVTFQCGVFGQAWNLIVSIPDLCLLSLNMIIPIIMHFSSLKLERLPGHIVQSLRDWLQTHARQQVQGPRG